MLLAILGGALLLLVGGVCGTTRCVGWTSDGGVAAAVFMGAALLGALCSLRASTYLPERRLRSQAALDAGIAAVPGLAPWLAPWMRVRAVVEDPMGQLGVREEEVFGLRLQVPAVAPSGGRNGLPSERIGGWIYVDVELDHARFAGD